jgi:superfamily II DNA or RNA helicase
VQVRLTWFAGTVEVHGLAPDALSSAPSLGAQWDARTACFRLPAVGYAALVLWLRDRGMTVVDEARAYGADVAAAQLPALRPFQEEALQAWRAAQGRGVVVLPTGAGKTVLALAAIANKRRDTLVVVPTLDLVRQWRERLVEAFGCAVGAVGGGEHDVKPLTVTTYDSAWTHMEHLGNRFGMVVFDEVHHLCAESYAFAARLCLAPYRLGLSATPERADGRDALLAELIGNIVYRQEIDALEGAYLADYDTERVEVALTEDERDAYLEARAQYRGFVMAQGIRMSDPQGWSTFLMRASRSAEGRAALAAYRAQRRISFATPQKLDVLADLLERHRGTRTLVFSDDNATAYAVSRRFLVPVITHQTKLKERTDVLRAFADGRLPVVATSRVLNEGVDVPEAEVAIVLSGSGSVREHVQRLGRILRKREGKRARLYELVTEETAEALTSERRRQHIAYR